MSTAPRSWKRRILTGILGVTVLAAGAYLVAFRATRPDPSKLTAWGTDLDKALAEAATFGRLLLVKAGSEY